MISKKALLFDNTRPSLPIFRLPIFGLSVKLVLFNNYFLTKGELNEKYCF
jgi:hypothetical protein